MSFVIRAAGEADIVALQAIEIDAGRRFAEIGMMAIAEDDPPCRDDLRRHILDGTAWMVADEVDGRRLGYLLASIVDGEGHVDQVSVLTDAQGRGIGTALLKAAAAWTISNGMFAVTLTTFRDVAWNAPFYEHRGFRPLRDADLGPELRAIRQAEVEAGLDLAGPRIAMYKSLNPG